MKEEKKNVVIVSIRCGSGDMFSLFIFIFLSFFVCVVIHLRPSFHFLLSRRCPLIMALQLYIMLILNIPHCHARQSFPPFALPLSLSLCDDMPAFLPSFAFSFRGFIKLWPRVSLFCLSHATH